MGSTPAFTTDRIRNIVVVGHGGSGKTTLLDACCFAAGSSRRLGSATDGSAITMYTPEEIGHGISMNCSIARAEWVDHKINLIDTPGYLDFSGETRAGVRVADAALVVISAPDGVEVGTERVWEMIRERRLPAIIFVSMMDRQNADFERAFADIRDHLTTSAIPVEIPIGAGDGFRGIINLFTERALIHRPDAPSEVVAATDIPEEYRVSEEKFYADLIETIAATDDTLLEHYLEGETISREEAVHALKSAMLRGELVPVFCGTSTAIAGIQALLTEIVELMPSPQEAPPELCQGRGDSMIQLRNLNSDPFGALVFKTTSEPHIGELSYFRIFGGSVTNGQDVYNVRRESTEKLSHLSIPHGRERQEVDALRAGDIGVVAKLKDTHTNDSLSSPAHPLALEGIDFPIPDISAAVEVETRGDEDKLSHALHMLHEEDPCFIAEYAPELGQTIARGCGELHLEVQFERMKRKNNVTIVTSEPRIAYRETVRRPVEAHGRYRKQTGGRGQFGDCHIRLRPLPRGEEYRFVDAIVGGVIPGKFIPAVDKGIQEAAERGVVAGYPMVDFEAECFFGSYHSVDSSEVAFKVAGSMAFRDAAERAGPVLLEPVMQVEVDTPEEYLGDVIGDLNQRRGRIQGIEPGGRTQRGRALVPQSELYRYATTLRSLTQGRGAHARRFSSYEEVPESAVRSIIESTGREKEQEILAR